MPNEKKKVPAPRVSTTGAVPKIKCRNDPSRIVNQPDFHRNLSNLDLHWQRQDCTPNFYGNKNPASRVDRFHGMENAVPEDCTFQNAELPSTNASQGIINGSTSAPSTSGSNSRRDSLGTIPKCDNVKKCPDKKQIEDKLNQIREYLQVTTSLMSSIKNNDDESAAVEREQFETMIKDLKDSEKKLLILLDDPLFDDSVEMYEVENEENHNMDVAVSEHMHKFSQLLDILTCQQVKLNNTYNTNNGIVENGTNNFPQEESLQKKELEQKVEFTNRKVQMLNEQQRALINLKAKAENQLRDARIAQENLLISQRSQKGSKKKNEVEQQHHGTPIENIQKIDEYQTQSSLFENSNQILHILDNRDAELNSEHLELQQKFNDLQSKKLQIDRLTQQLENLGEEDEEDIGTQVRKIVTMKQQLSNLKDLLEVVKNTENTLVCEASNLNGVHPDLVQENASATNVQAKKDNIRQEGRSKGNQNERQRSSNNRLRMNQSNQQCNVEKQSNKRLLKMQEQEKVLAELKAKKRELEEIMYKQKDRSSINNDVCSESSMMNKSDVGTSNTYDNNNIETWWPAEDSRYRINSTYSSDGCPEEDVNEYSDLNSTLDVPLTNMPPPQPLLNLNYGGYGKPWIPSSVNEQINFTPQQSTPVSSEHDISSMRMSSVFDGRRTIPDSISDVESNRNQVLEVQKQLEAIQSVCQTLLEQQQSSNNVSQLRNNLTPSPYAEPRSFVPQALGQTLNSSIQNGQNNFVLPQPFYGINDVTNNQNMLAANTLQTQAFLLNTLNQCCQMLWYQQREIANLKNTVLSMQNRIGNEQPEQDMGVTSSNVPASSSFLFPNRPVSSLSSFRSPSFQQYQRNAIGNLAKINQVSSACSLPNLNPLRVHVTNMENANAAYASQHNNVTRQSARLLEAALNNSDGHQSHGIGNDQALSNNTVLSSVNTNQPQMWNGQALNNQVPPGNRANNYWDNFRSYSRQNLLSTTSKSNDVLQNPLPFVLDNERSCTSFSAANSIPKLNPVTSKPATNTSEDTPLRHQIYLKSLENLEHSKKHSMSTMSPDILNSTHNRNNERHKETQEMHQIDLDMTSQNRELLKSLQRNRNEWHHEEEATVATNNLPKHKLFEELRDNVYCEVANLISANVSRPHFLIQLFRDLQHINSDPLRGRTLQSIQSVIGNSLNNLENRRISSRQQFNESQLPVEGATASSDCFSSHWVSQSPVAASAAPSRTAVNLDEDEQSNFCLPQSIIDCLHHHSERIIDQNFIDLLKQLVLAENFAILKENSSYDHLYKCCSVIINGALLKFMGKRVVDSKGDVLNSLMLIIDFLKIYTLQEIQRQQHESGINISGENDGSLLTQQHRESSNNLSIDADGGQHHDSNEHSTGFTLNLNPQAGTFVDDTNTPHMLHNGDLAEADQSRIELHDEEEEEGAVGGGVLNIFLESGYSGGDFVDATANITDFQQLKIDVPPDANAQREDLAEQLDQVPTRLLLTTVSCPSNSGSSKVDSAENY